MENVPVFLVEKFFPPRCPRCEHAFHSKEDFGMYGGKGSSFANAKMRQAQLFPELYQTDGGIVEDRFGIDFINCRHCDNVTLRIHYGFRQVMSREEAQRLVTSAGFTCWTEGVAYGDMARPSSTLFALGTADLAKLNSSVIEARARAAEEGDDAARGDAFAAVVEPALVEVVKKIHESQVTSAATERLRTLVGALWGALGDECRGFLLTAELLKDALSSYAETDPSIDFSPAVAAYSKALEKDLLEKLFIAFAGSAEAATLPSNTGRQEWDKSIAALRGFVAGQRELTLGDMGFCLLNVGCRMRNVDGNGFARFLAHRLHDLDALCERRHFPGRVIEYVQEYRNKSAHVGKISRDECTAARAYLLEEPIRLLISLEEMLA